MDEIALNLRGRETSAVMLPDGVGGTLTVGRNALVTLLFQLRRQLRAGLSKSTTDRELSIIREGVEENVSDPDARRKPEDLIAQHTAVGRAADSEQARDAAFDMEMRKGIKDLKERRWKMWWSLLQREPIAVLVGAFLLVGFSVMLVVAMFTHTDIPEVMLNMVLLILGFFIVRLSGQVAGGLLVLIPLMFPHYCLVWRQIRVSAECPAYLPRRVAPGIPVIHWRVGATLPSCADSRSRARSTNSGHGCEVSNPWRSCGFEDLVAVGFRLSRCGAVGDDPGELHDR
ncbi:hypothetical protein HGA13_04110 [Nocardia speluncae]|uniref:Uncharacterized protein n=1 Tax=Nocardia speluncae TaxID=419477 RepID=A0A846X8F8_9NOCA|nr:hypothetical protein [Nocardia speluncae]NKY32258.1 hypothetical protein [Nocardia speluncae]